MDKLMVFIAAIMAISCASNNSGAEDNIRPWSENRHYWEYKGNPVLLLGATDNDNLFQIQNLESHLDSLRMAGGNCVRNTMSDRDPGNKRAFALAKEGKYDLNKWNKDYWESFENLLRLAEEREIIVQIEIWDRFDHSRDQWLTDPFNPKNNINYTYTEAGLDSVYPLHPGQNKQPFFFAVPELDYNETLLKYQKAFVEKLLSVSLNYGNVLYCIDNETSGVEAWATFWAGFIKENSKGKEIYMTQMWDDWDVKSATHKRTIDHPERYGFIDISQNSQLPGQQNWDNAQYVFNYIKDNPRPVNSTKIYGSDKGTWLDRGITTEHAVQTFCRNVLGGFASSRFHRPPAGLGLSQTTINCIRTVRKIEEKVKLWDIISHMDLIKADTANLAYLAARQGEVYIIYFTGSGKVELDLTGDAVTFQIEWIPVETAEWSNPGTIVGGGWSEIESEMKGSCFAVLKKTDIL